MLQDKFSPKKFQSAFKNLKDLNEPFYSDIFNSALVKMSATLKK
jgi:hypothetical protein